MGVTISTHNGSAVARQHNLRNEKVVSKEQHINAQGEYEIWRDERPQDAYKRLFGQAVKDYNEKQTRAERRITNYYKDICKDDKKHPVYEMIIGIYGKDEQGNPLCSQQTGKEIMQAFVDTWQDRNPNLELIGAYYHNDEQGEPHVHIDYIPVAHGYQRGMHTQSALVKALGEQGFTMQKGRTAQILWEERENKYLDRLCRIRNLEVEHPQVEGRTHIDTSTYKASQALVDLERQVTEWTRIQSGLKADISRLTDERDITNRQLIKAAERLEKALKKSFTKAKDYNGVSYYKYNKDLENQIKELKQAIHKDVEAISHTDLELTRRAEQIEEKAKSTQKLHDEIQQTKDNQDNYILATAHLILEHALKQERDSKDDYTKRLEQYCEQQKFKDGLSVLDKFNIAEKFREERIKENLKVELQRQVEDPERER